MFWFQHPRPPSRKEVAEQVVMRKHAAPDIKIIIVDRPAPAQAAQPDHQRMAIPDGLP